MTNAGQVEIMAQITRDPLAAPVSFGEVAERLNALVSKTSMSRKGHRGFESPPLRLVGW